MAVVATSTTLLAEISNFTAPAHLGGEPFSVAEWIGSLTVPAKLAADDSLVTIIQTFPLNFVFKIATINVHYLNDTGTELLDLVDEFTPGVIGQGFASTNQNLVIEIVNGQSISQFDVTGDDIMLTGRPRGDYQIPIRTGQFSGDNTMVWKWSDTTSDSTVEIAIFFRMRALMYTIEQFEQYQMFAAQPVIGV